MFETTLMSTVPHSPFGNCVSLAVDVLTNKLVKNVLTNVKPDKTF